ncbi:MAG: fumarate hydratase, partial [Oscillospiraceae bacterium]|nr:fumarate hydratase [Oscillospiraceae bacterium]
MREIKAELITETVERLCIEACTMLGEDMKTALKKAESEETAPAARAALNDIVRNYECAYCEGLPI